MSFLRSSKVHLAVFTSFSLGFSVFGCATAPETPSDAGVEADAGMPAGPKDVERVMTLLTGRFDSSAQSQTSAAYYAVQLHACAVELPDLGERVLYVEQAMMSSLGSPYRQRLYVLTEDESEGTVTSTIYSVLQPERFVGTCAGADVPRINALDAELRVGCEVILRADGDGYTGSTVEKNCESSLNGASYATSEVTLSEDTVLSWDRGYDAMDNQVWGAEAGPYIFDRKE